MRAVRPVLALAGSLAAVVTGCSSPAAPGPARERVAQVSYYLSLGDSLSRGVQPGSAGARPQTPDGYPHPLSSAPPVPPPTPPPAHLPPPRPTPPPPTPH